MFLRGKDKVRWQYRLLNSIRLFPHKHSSSKNGDLWWGGLKENMYTSHLCTWLAGTWYYKFRNWQWITINKCRWDRWASFTQCWCRLQTNLPNGVSLHTWIKLPSNTHLFDIWVLWCKTTLHRMTTLFSNGACWMNPEEWAWSTVHWICGHMTQNRLARLSRSSIQSSKGWGSPIISESTPPDQKRSQECIFPNLNVLRRMGVGH